MNNMITSVKSKINFDAPEEQDVLRLIYLDSNTNTPRGFLDVFTKDEVLQMWSSKAVRSWSISNKDWLDQTAGMLIDEYTDLIK